MNEATRRGVGRPKLPEGRARDRLITFRVSDAEMVLIQSAAALDGETVSDWIRGMAISVASDFVEDPPRDAGDNLTQENKP